MKDLISKILETDPKKRYSLADIRKHEWYKLASDTDIPHDFVSVADKESIHNATMKTIIDNGHDAQTILDGVASHACNGSTALYYLLLQKNKNSLNRPPGQAQLTNHIAVAKPIDVIKQQVQSDSNTKDVVPPIEVLQKKVPQQVVNPTTTTATINVEKVNTTVVNVEKNIPKNVTTNVNPPVIVRPNMNPVSLASNNYSGFTQSTNPYLQMAKPQGKTNSSGNIRSGDGNIGITTIDNNLAKMNLNTTKPNIPTLNLHNNSNNIKEVMVSQTSRPNPSAQYPSIVNNSTNKQPQSARPVLPTDKPPNFSNVVENGAIEASMPSALADILGGAVTANVDSDGRPSTRRSRARSRGDGDSNGARDRTITEQNKIDFKELATGIESFPATDDTTPNVPLTINTENIVDRDNSTVNAIMMPMFTVHAPDMSTRKSDSSNNGGRRGKNIT